MMLREWVVIALILGFMVSIALIAKFSEVRDRTALIAETSTQTPLFQVTLSGAVHRPGVYDCKPGSALKELLKEAGLTPQANKKKIDFKRIIYTSQTIEIPHILAAEKNSFEQK